jgi:hypothetical protein
VHGGSGAVIASSAMVALLMNFIVMWRVRNTGIPADSAATSIPESGFNPRASTTAGTVWVKRTS